MTWTEIGNILGLVGSALLAIPALRLSSYLKEITGVATRARDRATRSKDPGKELVKAMEGHLNRWNRLDHWLLVIGLALLASAFAVPFLD